MYALSVVQSPRDDLPTFIKQLLVEQVARLRHTMNHRGDARQQQSHRWPSTSFTNDGHQVSFLSPPPLCINTIISPYGHSSPIYNLSAIAKLNSAWSYTAQVSNQSQPVLASWWALRGADWIKLAAWPNYIMILCVGNHRVSILPVYSHLLYFWRSSQPHWSFGPTTAW